jgi:hypothetical protein
LDAAFKTCSVDTFLARTNEDFNGEPTKGPEEELSGLLPDEAVLAIAPWLQEKAKQKAIPPLKARDYSLVYDCLFYFYRKKGVYGLPIQTAYIKTWWEGCGDNPSKRVNWLCDADVLTVTDHSYSIKLGKARKYALGGHWQGLVFNNSPSKTPTSEHGFVRHFIALGLSQNQWPLLARGIRHQLKTDPFRRPRQPFTEWIPPQSRNRGQFPRPLTFEEIAAIEKAKEKRAEEWLKQEFAPVEYVNETGSSEEAELIAIAIEEDALRASRSTNPKAEWDKQMESAEILQGFWGPAIVGKVLEDTNESAYFMDWFRPQSLKHLAKLIKKHQKGYAKTRNL